MRHEVFRFCTAETSAHFSRSVIQGVGGGGILNLSDIIVSDLVPLAERGIYEGLLGLVWAFASGIGPPVVCSSCLFYSIT